MYDIRRLGGSGPCNEGCGLVEWWVVAGAAKWVPGPESSDDGFEEMTLANTALQTEKRWHATRVDAQPANLLAWVRSLSSPGMQGPVLAPFSLSRAAAAGNPYGYKSRSASRQNHGRVLGRLELWNDMASTNARVSYPLLWELSQTVH